MLRFLSTVAIIYSGFILFMFSPDRVWSAENMIWPVDAKEAITSSFSEFRSGHFHSGIDLKVYGSMRLPCRAIEDGWVSRSYGIKERAPVVKYKKGGNCLVEFTTVLYPLRRYYDVNSICEY